MMLSPSPAHPTADERREPASAPAAASARMEVAPPLRPFDALERRARAELARMQPLVPAPMATASEDDVVRLALGWDFGLAGEELPD